jgi:hypothetical protein
VATHPPTHLQYFWVKLFCITTPLNWPMRAVEAGMLGL